MRKRTPITFPDIDFWVIFLVPGDDKCNFLDFWHFGHFRHSWPTFKAILGLLGLYHQRVRERWIMMGCALASFSTYLFAASR